MSEPKKNDAELGALWVKSGAKGEYMTGNIEGVGPVVCFRSNSDNPKAPAWRVMKSKPREDRPADQPTQSSDIGW